MKKEDTKPYVLLEVIREDRISFPLNGRNLSVKLANAEDFLAFISGAVNAVNIKAWSIFMRWNAVNLGLGADTLTVSREEERYTLALAEPKKVIEELKKEEDFPVDKVASEAS